MSKTTPSGDGYRFADTAAIPISPLSEFAPAVLSCCKQNISPYSLRNANLTLRYPEHRQIAFEPYKQGTKPNSEKSPFYISNSPPLSTLSEGEKPPRANLSDQVCGSASSRTIRERETSAGAAARFAWERQTPLEVLVTVSWWACQAGAVMESHILGEAECKRCKLVIARLRRVAGELGFEPTWIWARAIGARMGAHFHVYAYWPSKHLRRLASELERLTGNPVADNIRGENGLFAKSGEGGWRVNLNYRGIKGSIGGALYLARQDYNAKAHFTGKCFGLTANINSTARRNAELGAVL